MTDRKKAGTKVIYSDFNFIVLGYLVQQMSGMSLAKYAQEEIYLPLHMNDTCFNRISVKGEESLQRSMLIRLMTTDGERFMTKMLTTLMV